MSERMVVVLKVLLLLSVSAPLSSAVMHCLRFYYTAVTPGLDFTRFTMEGRVDGEPFVTDDSRNPEWINKADNSKKWERNTRALRRAQKNFKADVVEGLKKLGNTGDEHTVQWMIGCGLGDDGTKRGFWRFGYDGQDFISLELKDRVWTATTDQAEQIKQTLENTEAAGFREDYLENECIDWLKKLNNVSSTQKGKGSRKRRSLEGCQERRVAGPSGGFEPVSGNSNAPSEGDSSPSIS